MSEGIIILDEIPEKCDQCLVRHPGLAYCLIARKSTSHSSTGKPLDEKKRPGWCPIRPIPEKYKSNGIYPGFPELYRLGWNACIEEILKGGENNA